MRRSLEELGFLSVGDPQAADPATRELLVRAMQAAVGMFTAAGRTEGTIELRFGEHTLLAPATGTTMDTSPVYWLDALWLAMTCRDRAKIDQLAAIPVDWLRSCRIASLPARAPPGLRRRSSGRHRSGGYSAVATDAVIERYYPPMELLHRLTQREDAFNDSLVTALELHKRQWSTAEQRRSPFGYIALVPLAMACLAHDAGVSIDVSSDYLPATLIDRWR